MTDVLDPPPTHRLSRSADPRLIELVELLFFAYRDFTAEPDQILAEYGLGRAHHRVLHFVRRNPGLRVTDLLAILKITKQSLSRVLLELSEGGWIERKTDGADKRARRLSLTAAGDDLAVRLARLQVERVRAAMTAAAADDREDPVRRFLFAMIAAEERDTVRDLLAAGDARQLRG